MKSTVHAIYKNVQAVYKGYIDLIVCTLNWINYGGNADSCMILFTLLQSCYKLVQRGAGKLITGTACNSKCVMCRAPDTSVPSFIWYMDEPERSKIAICSQTPEYSTNTFTIYTLVQIMLEK